MQTYFFRASYAFRSEVILLVIVKKIRDPRSPKKFIPDQVGKRAPDPVGKKATDPRPVGKKHRIPDPVGKKPTDPDPVGKTSTKSGIRGID
jgi:hypothetical protein